jgi:hypothetical protein
MHQLLGVSIYAGGWMIVSNIKRLCANLASLFLQPADLVLDFFPAFTTAVLRFITLILASSPRIAKHFITRFMSFSERGCIEG